jgi:hypothetical protein
MHLGKTPGKHGPLLNGPHIAMAIQRYGLGMPMREISGIQLLTILCLDPNLSASRLPVTGE